MKKSTIKIKNLINLGGFTLIELLVVLGIIALLAAISIFALQGARESARDTRRKADLESIRSAFELYRSDCNAYPASLPAPGSSLTASCTGPSNTYIEGIPGDPSSGSAYRYCPGAGNLTYDLYSHLEDSTTSIGGCGACNPSPCRYTVSNP